MRYLFLALKERTAHCLVHGDQKNEKVTPFVLLSVTFLFFCSAGTPARAEALKPWLQLTSGARPTYLHPGVAQDAVQRFAVSATAGHYTVEYKGKEHALKVGESSPELRESLEKLYGADNVEVSSAPGPYNAHEVYEVKFVDALADRPFPVCIISACLTGSQGISAYQVVVKDVEVTGGLGKVEAHEVVRGRPDGELVAFAENLGDATIDGASTPLQIVDTLPPHVKAVGVVASVPEGTSGISNTVHSLPCSLESASRVSCSLEGVYENEGKILPETLAPYQQIEVRIAVEVEPGAESGEVNEVVTSGGGAAAASLRRPLTISGEPTPGGLEDYELINEAAGGAADTQAGSHPFRRRTSIDLDQRRTSKRGEQSRQAARRTGRAVKDLSFKWPPGLVGNPAAVARCSAAQFLTRSNPAKNPDACPADTAVGVAVLASKNRASSGT